MAHRYSIWSALFLPHTGGVENFTYNLAKELVKQGDSVQIMTMRIDASPAHEVIEDRIDVWRLPCSPLMGGRLPLTKKNSEYDSLIKAASAFVPDRVLVNTRFYQHSIEGLKYAKSFGVEAVVLDHGSAHLTLGNPIADRVIESYEHRVTKKAISYDPIFCGISEKSSQWLEHFGIRSHGVVPNAIDAEAYRLASSGRDFRKELGIGDESVIVSFVGRLTPEKGPDKLLAAAKKLDDSSINYILAGDGFLRSRLEADASSNIYFVGNLNREDTSSLLQQSDLFCLPSRSEGFCTSLLEASSCGTAAVITDVGGARELIPNESYGMILDGSDVEAVSVGIGAMCSLGKSALRAMGENCLRLVEAEHGWASTVRALEMQFR